MLVAVRWARLDPCPTGASRLWPVRARRRRSRPRRAPAWPRSSASRGAAARAEHRPGCRSAAAALTDRVGDLLVVKRQDPADGDVLPGLGHDPAERARRIAAGADERLCPAVVDLQGKRDKTAALAPDGQDQRSQWQ